MKKKLITTRTVTRKECYWLDADILEGTELFRFSGPTYGCVDYENGIAASVDGGTPFFEIPINAIRWIE